MQVDVNKQMTTQYIRNVINSFSKMGRDVTKDSLLPSTSSLVFNASDKIKEIKDYKYTFNKLKDKLTSSKFHDDKNFDNIEEGIEKEYYQFGREVKNVSDKNIKYFTKNTKNLKIISADLVSTEITKSIKSILLNSNNVFIDSISRLGQPVENITEFQSKIKSNFYGDTIQHMHSMLEMFSDINNSFANFAKQKLNGLVSDITENRMASLIKVERMFSMDELDNTFKRMLKKFGIDEDESESLLKLAMKKPALGILKTLITINTDKNKGYFFDDLKSIPKNLNNYLALALNKFKENENPVVRLLGEKFAPEKKDSEVIYRDNYHKESTKFDTNSKRAITHVIPTLLAQILNKLENTNNPKDSEDNSEINAKELVYDYDNGGFTTRGAVSKLESKDKKIIQKRINNLEDANKQRKSVKNLLNYRNRFSGAITVEYERRNEKYEQTRSEFKIQAPVKLNIVNKIIMKIDNFVFNIEKPDSKLANAVDKVLSFANSIIDPATGMPSIENIKNAIIKPIKNKFMDYVTSVKNYVKETYKIAVDSVITAFKKPETDNDAVKFKDKLKTFLSEKILIPLTSKLNDIKANLLLKVKDKAKLIVRSLKRKIEAKKGSSSYLSNSTIEDRRDIDIDLKNDTYGFNLVKYNMLGIGIELSPIRNIVNTMSSRISDVIHDIKKRTKTFEKDHKDDNPKEVKPTFKILETASKYSSYLFMFAKDVVKSLEPMTLAFKGFQTLKRMALNILGTVTDAFVGIFKEATRFVKNVISIFTQKIPAALKYIDRFTGTVATLLKSKISLLPMMAVGAIITGGTVLINKMNSILISATGSAIEVVGKSIRSLLLTARLLGNSLNKAMTMGKFYIKRVLQIGSRMLGNMMQGRNPNINKLEFAKITGGHLDYIKNIITAEVIKKDTRIEDEKEDDQKDIQRVKNIAEKVTGKMSKRIEERTEAIEDLLQKLMATPVKLIGSLFSNVIGFIMGGSIGSFIGNMASKAWSFIGNTKLGRLFGLNKASQLIVKKVWIDGGSLDSNDSIIDDVVDGLDGNNGKIANEVGEELVENKSVWKKLTGFISKHKKGAVVAAIAAVVTGGYLFKKNKDKKEQEEQSNAEPYNSENAVVNSTKTTAEPVNTSNDELNKDEIVESNGTTVVQQTAVKSSSAISDDETISKIMTEDDSQKTTVVQQTAVKSSSITSNDETISKIMTEDDSQKNMNKNTIKMNTAVNDNTVLKAVKDETVVDVSKTAAITPAKQLSNSKQHELEGQQYLNSFNNVDKSTNELKEIYRENIHTNIENRSVVYKNLRDSDKELMLAQEGVQGIYRKTADPAEYDKLSKDRLNYKGMLKDFLKGFKYGGMMFGVVNVLAKKVDLSKFRNLIKDKQKFINFKTSIRKSLLGIGIIGGISGGGSSSPGGGGGGGSNPGGVVGPGGNIDWPTGNMKLGEKLVMYAKAFLPQGKINYSQPLRDKIDNQGNRADCSSFVRHIYKTVAGVNPGNVSGEQGNAGQQVSDVSQLREGDILWKSGHVGMYAGGNKYIDVGGPTNGSNDPKWKDITSFNYFTMGRRVINPDQMVDNKLNNPNTALTGLTSDGIQTGGTSNADRSASSAIPISKIGDPPEDEINNEEPKSNSAIVNTDFKYETKSFKDKTRNKDNEIKKIDKIEKRNESIAKNQTKDVSLQSLVDQKIKDNTIYSKEGTIHKLQKEIVNILESIDVDIKALLDIDNEMIVYLKQVEGL